MKCISIKLSLLAVLFVMGCANQELTDSGHIANINNLQEVKVSKVEKHKKLEKFVVADARVRQIDHIAIGPVRFKLPESVDKKLKDKDKEKLAAYFDKSIRKELEGYPVLEGAPQFVPQNTYFVDVVITNLDGSNAPLNFILTATVALPFDTGGITAEGRIIEIDTDEEVAAFRGYREGTMFHIVGGMTKYGHAEGGLKLYAEEIRKLLKDFNCPNCIEVNK